MNMIRKGQLKGVDKGDVVGQIALVAKVLGVAIQAQRRGLLPAHLIFFIILAPQPSPLHHTTRQTGARLLFV
jgi:hypothetical protein